MTSRERVLTALAGQPTDRVPRLLYEEAIIIPLLAIAMASAAASAEPLHPPPPGQSVSLRSLLAEMTDRDATAKWPVPAFTLKQASSYDRKSTNPADAGTWFANCDSGQFIRIDMEIRHHTSTQLDYAVGTFWYARPGATHNRPPQPAEAALPLATLPAPGQKRPPLKIAGAQEGEALEIVARSPGLVAGIQDLRDHGGGWSRDAHLFVQAQQPGDFVEVAIPAQQPGAKTITLHATKSADYGLLRFTVNGKAAGPDFDGFASQPIPSGPINLGVHQPKDGKFILRAEVVGTHPASTGKRYFFAIDCVVLQAP